MTFPFDHLPLSDADDIIRRIAKFGHDRAVMGLIFRGMNPDRLDEFLTRNGYMVTRAQEAWQRRQA
jgi:hypothetical protein